MKAAKQLGAAFVAGVMCVGSANAISLLDSSMYDQASDPLLLDGDGNVTVGGVTFVANGNPAGVVFTVGSNGGFSGLGVSGGPTNTEIDIFESITMSWGYYAAVEDFSLALLYNGPEFGDVREVAQVSASIEGGGTVVGTLTVAPLLDNATWSIFSGNSPATNLDPATLLEGGAWLVTNPFGNLRVNQLVFTALFNPVCGSGSCYNQSDYVLSSVNVVPEPGTYSLLLAGLAAMGFIARRRRVPS